MTSNYPASDADLAHVVIRKFTNIVYEKEGHAAIITVNRPEAMNALSRDTVAEIGDAIADAHEDRAVRGVIITGAGKAFVAGADIHHLVSVDAVGAEHSTAFGQGVLSLIENLGKPVIAAVNGHALGGGCELAMACAIRIASQHAKFGQPEVKLGVLPGYGGTQRLPRLVGKGQALQLILTGQIIDAQEALRIGLVNEVVPAESLLARAHEILAAIAANAPIATRLAMEAVNRGENMPLADAIAFERLQFAICASTEDKREGTSAFLEKRKAVFHGR